MCACLLMMLLAWSVTYWIGAIAALPGRLICDAAPEGLHDLRLETAQPVAPLNGIEALVAAQTAHDAPFLAGPDLLQPVGIGDKAAANRHQVAAAGGQGPPRLRRRVETTH